MSESRTLRVSLTTFLLILGGIPVGGYAGMVASLFIATRLFALNAPDAAQHIETGLSLFAPVVWGALAGAVTLPALIARHAGYCLLCGACLLLASLITIPFLARYDAWEGFDALAFTLLCAALLLLTGYRKRAA